jgi:hypothetical protein
MSKSSFGRFVFSAVTAGVMGRATAVIKTEVEIAKKEVESKLKALGAGAVMVLIAASLLSLAFLLLLAAGLHALTYVWPLWLVLVVVGGGLLLVGIIFVAAGLRKIKKNKDLMPDRAINNIKAVFGK